MTIGIGAICETGSCIVLGADTRGSYDAVHRLSPNDKISKTYDLPHDFFLNFAGTINSCHSVSAQMAFEFSNLRDHFEIDHVRFAVNGARFYERNMIAGDQIHAAFGLSLADWQRLPLDSRVYSGGKAIIRSVPIDGAFIVAGFLKREPEEVMPNSTPAVLLSAWGKEPVQMENNFAVIGSGAKSAMRVLNKRGQHIFRSWQRTAIDVIEAMLAAHRSDRRHVGVPADLFIISEKETKRFPPDAQFVKTLREKIKRQKIQNYDGFDDKTNEILASLLIRHPSVSWRA